MATEYWTALRILDQVASELAIARPTSITGASDAQSVQLLALLNSAGNELYTYYPWEQFLKEYTFTTQVGIDEYRKSVV